MKLLGELLMVASGVLLFAFWCQTDGDELTITGGAALICAVVGLILRGTPD